MIVIYLHQYFNSLATSGSTRSYEFGRRLVKSGHKVVLLTTSAFLGDEYAPTEGWHRHIIDGIHVEVLRVPYSNDMPFSERIRSFLAFGIGAFLHGRRFDPDIVFATSTPLTIAVPALLLKLWHRVPMVFEVRDLWPELPIAIGALRNPVAKLLANILEWIAYHSSSRIIALSPGMADGVIRRGIDGKRVTVIPNSCDVDIFDVPTKIGDWARKRLGLAFEQPLIVYTGTFGMINGVGYLVEIAQAMCAIAPNVRFLLVGGGAEFDQVKEQADMAGILDESLWVWSSLKKSEIPAILAAATVTMSLFIPLKPMWNNSANKFFDGLAAGKPIAINYGGWQAELLKNTGAGIVLPSDNAKVAAQMLAEFACDAERLERASEAARRLAHERFDRGLLFERFKQVLIESLKR